MNERITEYGQKAAELPENVTMIPAAKATEKKRPINITVNWKKEEDSYEVQGETLEEACKFLEQRGGWGKFESEIYYDCDVEEETKMVTKVELRPGYRITMPIWPAYKDQPKRVKARWDDMWKILRKHEDNHVGIFKEVIRKLIEDLNELDRVGKAKYGTVFERLEEARKTGKEKQNKYDNESKYGEKEGLKCR